MTDLMMLMDQRQVFDFIILLLMDVDVDQSNVDVDQSNVDVD